MNRIWKLLVCTSLFMAMIFSSGLVSAEPKAIDGVWPPASGVYVRKTASGIPNGRIDVMVVNGFYNNPAVLVGVESRNYEGNSYEGSDMAPRIYIAGHMDVGLNYGEVFLTHGYTDKRNPKPDPKILPPMTYVVYNAAVEDKKITLTPQMFDATRAMRTDPDLAGIYVFEGVHTSPSAFMAIAWVRQQNPKLTGLELGRDYRYEDDYITDVRKISYPGIQAIRPPIAPKEYFELKAYDGNTPVRTFLVSKDFNQIYRIKPNGEAMLIFNNQGGVG